MPLFSGKKVQQQTCMLASSRPTLSSDSLFRCMCTNTQTHKYVRMHKYAYKHAEIFKCAAAIIKNSQPVNKQPIGQRACRPASHNGSANQLGSLPASQPVSQQPASQAAAGQQPASQKQPPKLNRKSPENKKNLHWDWGDLVKPQNAKT